MPEAGLIPIPRKLAEQGVEDMLRISDGRMSGTAGGTILLHVSPESADPKSVLGVVKDGDWIVLDAEKREVVLEVGEEELEKRKEERKERERGKGKGIWEERRKVRGYRGLYMREVNSAEEGADFGFLTAKGPFLGPEEEKGNAKESEELKDVAAEMTGGVSD